MSWKSKTGDERWNKRKYWYILSRHLNVTIQILEILGLFEAGGRISIPVGSRRSLDIEEDDHVKKYLQPHG